MKKLIIILCFVFSAAGAMGAFAWYQSHMINPGDILQISLYESREDMPSHVFYNEDTPALTSIADILSEMRRQKVSDFASAAGHEFSLSVMKKSGEQLHFTISARLEGPEVFILDQDRQNTYRLPAEQAKTLLSMPGFESLYEASPPTVHLTYSTMTIPSVTTESNWTYRLADGSVTERRQAKAADQAVHKIPLNASHPVEFYAEKQPDLVTLRVFKDDKLLFSENIADGKIQPYLYDGTLRYEITSQWPTSENGSYGQSVTSFFGYMDIEPSMIMDNSQATAGDLIVIEVSGINEDQTVRVEQSISKDFALVKNGDRYIGFLSMNYWAEPGLYDLNLIVEGPSGIEFNRSYPVQILKKDFKKQYLTVDKTVESSTRNEKAYAEYAEYFTPIRDQSVLEKLWEGPFILPVEGRISTEFGEMRYVNGALTSYRHSGIDIAAPKGTPISAPNHGRVKLSRSLILTGETLVIDHGYGIFSVYFHLDSRNVETGQMVKKGDLIGTVGSTGFSTGPHLHWTMSHYQTNLNPWLFIERDLLSDQ